ncbi:extracellular solute-binding protein [Palleronia caenipelagi]|uniref:extracellular solute-binding protein n=1 Tax=Palleronia caenipelagi TaxID=2489174 RepID=UPI00163D60AD|nr:extracellular solute-binding protein [Palleronia caenipelagi]
MAALFLLANVCLMVMPAAVRADETTGTARIELLHLWRTPGEQAALHVFRDALSDPSMAWFDTPVQGGATGVRKQLSDLLAAEAQPNIIQWIPSEELNQLFDLGVFRTVDTVDEDFADKLLPEIREVAETDGVLRVLPVGIHTYDFMAYNRQLFERLGIELPTSWESYLALGPLLAESGVPLLSVSDENWQLTAMYRTLMISEFSKEEVLSMARGEADLETYRNRFETTFEILFELRRFAAPDREDLRWEETVARVERGEALSILLGDYIVAAFDDPDKLICARSPQSSYIPWGFDSFVFTHVDDPVLLQGQTRFAKAASDIDNIVNYVMHKGGLPVISGVTPDQLDRCNADTLVAWQKRPLLWEGLLQGKNRIMAMNAVIVTIWRDETITPAQAAERVIDAMSRP